MIGSAFRGALAIGTTLTELLVAVITEPDRIVQHVLSALDEMNQTVTGRSLGRRPASQIVRLG